MKDLGLEGEDGWELADVGDDDDDVVDEDAVGAVVGVEVHELRDDERDRFICVSVEVALAWICFVEGRGPVVLCEEKSNAGGRLKRDWVVGEVSGRADVEIDL